MRWVTENHPELGTGEAKWNGSFPGMWGSTYWEEYKSLRANDKENKEEYDYTKCTNTNIKGNLDEVSVEIRQPFLSKAN